LYALWYPEIRRGIKDIKAIHRREDEKISEVSGILCGGLFRLQQGPSVWLSSSSRMLSPCTTFLEFRGRLNVAAYKL